MRPSKYFEGFEAKADPNPHRIGRRVKMIYTGDYYGLAIDAKQRQRLCRGFLLLYLLFLVLYFWLALSDTPCILQVYVQIPLLAMLIPLFFHTLGMISFLSAGEKWPKRHVRGIYHRLRWSSILLTLLTLAVFVGQLVAMLCLKSFHGTDWLRLSASGVMLSLPVTVLYYEYKYPVCILS